MRLLLALDLSTTCTGWALYDRDSKKLLEFGKIKAKVKGLTKMTYPNQQLQKMRNLSEQIVSLIKAQPVVPLIVIEEINPSKNRMGQKTLDGFHFLLVDRMGEDLVRMVRYIDSDGPTGWRTRLNLRLTEDDKRLNKERKRLNKLASKHVPALPIITKKHLACRLVNKVFGMNFDVDKSSTDSDVVDAIGLGLAALSLDLEAPQEA